MSPHVFGKDPEAGGFGTGIPLEIFRNLHRIPHHSPVLNRHPAVADFLKTHRLPIPTRGPRDPLFSGTVYLAQVTFNTTGGPRVTPVADMNVIVEYAQHAIVPISEYATAQYGANTVSVSSNILTYSANVPDGTFTDFALARAG